MNENRLINNRSNTSMIQKKTTNNREISEKTLWFVVKIDKCIWKQKQIRKKKSTNWKLLHRFQIGHLLWRVINQRNINQFDDVFFAVTFQQCKIQNKRHFALCVFFWKVVDVNGKLFPTISNWFIALFSIHLFHAQLKEKVEKKQSLFQLISGLKCKSSHFYVSFKVLNIISCLDCSNIKR